MPILVTCRCGKRLRTKDKNAGRRTTCPTCGRPVEFPGGACADRPEWPKPPPPPPAEWYFVREHLTHGPVAFPALAYLAASDGLSRTDLVWKAGMVAWDAAGSVEGLFPPRPPQPAEPPRTEPMAVPVAETPVPPAVRAPEPPKPRKTRRRRRRERSTDLGGDRFVIYEADDEDRQLFGHAGKPGPPEYDESDLWETEGDLEVRHCPKCGEPLNFNGFCENPECDYN